jgi:hypothetical protein
MITLGYGHLQLAGLTAVDRPTNVSIDVAQRGSAIIECHLNFNMKAERPRFENTRLQHDLHGLRDQDNKALYEKGN